MKRRTINILAVIAALGGVALMVWAASSGPNDPGTMADDSSIGTVAWSNVNNAKTQNDTYASALIAGTISHYLKATNFGFSIPSDATVDGIVVEVDKYESAAGSATDEAVRIVKGGTIGSTDKSSGSNWPTSDGDTYETYGGVTDLWGETWTASDINDSGLGFVISVTVPFGPVFDDNVFVDHIRMTVHYTEASGAAVQVQMVRW